jgi:chromosomal replication initiation ATPase DnaA
MKYEIFNDYVEKIVDLYKIPREEVFSKNKKMELVDARHLIYYLCSMRKIQITYIQRYMDLNGYVVGHSSIIHGIKVMEEKIAHDSDYKQIFDKIK